MNRLVAVVVATSLAGCSVFLVVPPPDPLPETPPVCDTSSPWPYADAVLAALSLPLAVLATRDVVDSEPSPHGSLGASLDGAAVGGMILFGGMTLGFAGSSIGGFLRMKRCRDAMRDAAP